jgi:hypothetical protein
MKITMKILLDKLLTANYGNSKIILLTVIKKVRLSDEVCTKNLGLDAIEQ